METIREMMAYLASHPLGRIYNHLHSLSSEYIHPEAEDIRSHLEHEMFYLLSLFNKDKAECSGVGPPASQTEVRFLHNNC